MDGVKFFMSYISEIIASESDLSYTIITDSPNYHAMQT